MRVNADNSGNQLKFDLQAAMQNYIEDRLVDGEYLYLDADNGVVARARPSAAHPTILQIKNGYILCSDFRTSAGEALNVDFFLARFPAAASLLPAESVATAAISHVPPDLLQHSPRPCTKSHKTQRTCLQCLLDRLASLP